MSGKDHKTVITEYASSLSEDALQFLTVRLMERLCGDLGDVLEELSKDKKIDEILSQANSSENLYNTLDNIRDILVKECKKKGVYSKIVSPSY